jgi:threonine dehydrogenase-like Zn-dependent dehydrogenase
VAVRYGGICGSDLHNLYPDGALSKIFNPFVATPMEMGHELSGVVVEAGPECPVAVGTRVTVDPTIACVVRGLEPCPACAAGQESACWNLGSRTFTGGFGIGFTTGLGGAWGTQLVAHPAQLHVVPDAVDDRAAALTEPLSVAVHALARHPLPDGEPVLVIGAGIIGLTAVVAARRAAPSSEVTVVAKHPHQAEAARRLGAHHVVAPDDDLMSELARLGGGTVRGRGSGATLSGGYRAVVEAVGNGPGVNLAARACATRGSLYLIGGTHNVSLDLAPIWFKELDVFGAFCHSHDGGTHSFDVALELLGAGELPADVVVTHTFPLEDVRLACDTAHDKSSGAIKVLLQTSS